MNREKILVTVSGGRTSAYLAIKMHREYQDRYDMRFVYANTGQEHEETLKFINKLQIKMGLPIIWIEAKVNPEKGKGTKYKIVDFKSASRKGEPFEEVIKKYGLPNKHFLHCTRELKQNPISALMVDFGISIRTLGIRTDELRRYRPSPTHLYPLIELFPTDKKKILKWWSKQSFDLNIPEHLGNCITCYKKSDVKLQKIVEESPKSFNFFAKMEKKYGDGKRIIFRGNRTTQDILNGKTTIEGLDDCGAEECGTVFIPTEEKRG